MTERGSWDPSQYGRFSSERRQPFDDLLCLCHRVPRGSIVDLGCGPGFLTVELHHALGARHTLGIDTSAAMISEAKRHEAGIDGVTFEQADIATWEGSGLDLIFANASLQWVDDHPALLSRLRTRLTAGGQLAFQVPVNFDHPSHQIAQEVASSSPFDASFGHRPPPSRAKWILSPSGYASCLYQLGATDQHVRLQVYGHLLASSEEVVEWVKGTALTPYKERLSEPEWWDFLRTCRDRLLERLGDQRPFFYPFPRILAWAKFDQLESVDA